MRSNQWSSIIADDLLNELFDLLNIQPRIPIFDMKNNNEQSPFSAEDKKLAPNSINHSPRRRTVKECLVKISEAKQDLGNMAAKKWLADLIRDRLRSRYVDPIFNTPDRHKNGFNIMAISCLLIETLECFWLGFSESNPEPKKQMKNIEGKNVDVSGGRIFNSFFHRRVPNLKELVATHDEVEANDTFYSHIRCGILHQGETSGSWRITKNRNFPTLDKKGRRINATFFHEEIASAVDRYTQHLKEISFTHVDWDNAVKKIEAICKKCKEISVKVKQPQKSHSPAIRKE